MDMTKEILHIIFPYINFRTPKGKRKNKSCIVNDILPVCRIEAAINLKKIVEFCADGLKKKCILI